MAILVALALILLNEQIGYMKKISVTNVGLFLYSTNKRLMITTIVSGVILIFLLFITIPLGIDSPLVRILYNLLGGLILALGYCHYKINSRN